MKLHPTALGNFIAVIANGHKDQLDKGGNVQIPPCGSQPLLIKSLTVWFNKGKPLADTALYSTTGNSINTYSGVNAG